MKQVDQNKQQSVANPKDAKVKTVSKQDYDLIVNENLLLKEENEKLKAKVKRMKIEFMQMSQLMEEILSKDN